MHIIFRGALLTAILVGLYPLSLFAAEIAENAKTTESASNKEESKKTPNAAKEKETSQSPSKKETAAKLSSPFTWKASGIVEEVSNLHGGIQRGSALETQGTLTSTFDTEVANLWQGGQLLVGITGNTVSHLQNKDTGALQFLSNISNPSGFHLSDFNYQQTFGKDLTFRFGLLDMNNYFNNTETAEHLLNDSFVIFPSLSENTNVVTYPDNGYGMMTSYKHNDTGVRLGFFQGAPQRRRTVFKKGYMAIVEMGHEHAFKYACDPKLTFTGGVYRYRQSDPMFGHSTSGGYAITEFNWKGQKRQYGVFLQLGIDPKKVNLVPYYLGTGLFIKGVLEERNEDYLSLGLARVWIQNAHRETAYEATYTVQVTEHLSLIPDVQYVITPSGVYPNAWVGIFRIKYDI